MKLCLLTPDPDFPEDHRWALDVEAGALRDAGALVEARPWTKAGNLSQFDAVLPLVAWGYHLRFADWLALLDRLEAEPVPVANPVPLLRWNSDKSYLAELGAKGIATVPTLAVDHLNEAALEAAFGKLGTDEVVVKPPVSAGATGTFRIARGEAAAVPAEVHGQRMMIQPWLRSITTTGEYSLILFGGEPSHCVVKLPKSGDFRVQPNFGGSTHPCAPPPGALELAKAALALAPTPATYARVDLVEGNDGTLQLIELELIEPALFLHCAPTSASSFANAILANCH